MKFFLDTANLDEIRTFASTGLIDGVTTNPSLMAKAGRPVADIVKEICSLISGPISVEVTATDYNAMLKQAYHLAGLSDTIAIKVPLTMDGLKACHRLRQDHIMVNVTLCFSPAQALLAAKAGATFISPFIGRLDDIGQDGLELVHTIREIYDQYPEITTAILAASVRHPIHVVDAARFGADVVTLPAKVLEQLYRHPLTDIGLEKFLSDWRESGLELGEEACPSP
ncbi:MAG: fructose-6-phosphate aldolase [Pseudomonadota bacterium]